MNTEKTTLYETLAVFQQGQQQLNAVLGHYDCSKRLLEELSRYVATVDQNSFILFEDELWQSLYCGMDHGSIHAHEAAVKVIMELIHHRPEYVAMHFARFLDLVTYGMSDCHDKRDRSWYIIDSDHFSSCVKHVFLHVNKKLCRCLTALVSAFPTEVSANFERVIDCLEMGFATQAQNGDPTGVKGELFYETFMCLVKNHPQDLVRYQDIVVKRVDKFYAWKGLDPEMFNKLKPVYLNIREHVGPGKKFGEIGGIYATSVEEWQAFYADYFSIDLDGDLFNCLSPCPDNQHELLVMAKGLTLSKIVECWEKKHRTHLNSCYRDIDVSLYVSKRNCEKASYALYVSYKHECDKDLINMTWFEMQNAGIETVTLEEYLILRLKSMHEWRCIERKNANSLDTRTICGGTRLLSGQACYVDFGFISDKPNLSVHGMPCSQKRDRWGSRQIYPAFMPKDIYTNKWSLLPIGQ